MKKQKKSRQTLLLASLFAFAVGGAHAQTATNDTQSTQAESTANQQIIQSENTAQSQDSPSTSGSRAQQTDSSGSSNQGTTQANSTEKKTASETSGSSKNQQGQQTASGKQNADAALIYMVVPVEVVTADDAMKRGCWVKLYDGQNYSGESLTLLGPTMVRDMSGPFGINWDDKVKSVQTGPRATLSVFDDEAYQERVAEFKPGQNEADVSKRLGFFDEFGSIRVDCQKS